MWHAGHETVVWPVPDSVGRVMRVSSSCGDSFGFGAAAMGVVLFVRRTKAGFMLDTQVVGSRGRTVIPCVSTRAFIAKEVPSWR